MLAVECSAFGVKVKSSTIPHDRAGFGAFSGRPFGAEDIVEYY